MDEHVERLARLFREHSAWKAAARHIEEAATSAVYFSHRPCDPWRLVRERGQTLLRPGPADDPDFVFRFTPASIERLEAVEGNIGDFAVELFTLITDTDPTQSIDFRIVAPFSRLVRRGYLGLLAAGGLRVLAFGASRGVRTLADLRHLIQRVGDRSPESWECTEGNGESHQPVPPASC
jgi:hypothetical protein